MNGVGLRSERSRSETGSALINALIFIAALAILGMALSKLSAFRLQEMQRKHDNLQAQWGAESGIDEALLRLQQDPAWYADGSETRPEVKRDWERWQYEVGVYPLAGANDYRIQSVGRAGRSSRTEARTVVLTTPTAYTLYALEKLTVGPQVEVSGPVYAGEKIEGVLPTSAAVDTYPRELHSAELPALNTFLELRPVRIIEGFLKDYRVENRFLHKQGALTLRTGTLTRTSIIVGGVLTVEGKTIATPAAGRPLFVVAADLLLNLAPGSRVEGIILCHGKATITGQGEIRGSIIARAIDLLGAVSVVHRPERDPVPGFPPRLNTLPY